MGIAVGGMSRFKDILEVKLVVRKDSLYITAEQKDEPNIIVKFLAFTSRWIVIH